MRTGGLYSSLKYLTPIMSVSHNPQAMAITGFLDPPHVRDIRYSSVTQPSEAFFTLLMYLYSVPRVAL